eukprot:TRINITY_DN252_c0_g1_i10.p2 TRINITY_DN252_c0_g1~~TRINITY_DN252_c0_g1_i10.p2  ORF type:complete len:172 (-),score=46.31 TRINITY_DN252_c0_g1_i10:533-1048(-)
MRKKVSGQIFSLNEEQIDIFENELENTKEISPDMLANAFSKLCKEGINGNLLSKIIFQVYFKKDTISYIELSVSMLVMSNISTDTKINKLYKTYTNKFNGKKMNEIFLHLDKVFHNLRLSPSLHTEEINEEEMSRSQFEGVIVKSKVKEKLDILYLVFHYKVDTDAKKITF